VIIVADRSTVTLGPSRQQRAPRQEIVVIPAAPSGKCQPSLLGASGPALTHRWGRSGTVGTGVDDGQAFVKIIVGVHGSLTSLAALRVALQEARDRRAVLVPVLAWIPMGGELAYRRVPCPPLLRVWRENARQQLATAFDEGLGGYPDDVEVRPAVVRGQAGPVLVSVADDADSVLVLGAGRRRVLGRRWRGATARYCLAHAAGPVLLVPPPELLRDAGRLNRRPWVRHADA
jgi:nucleotide-binding universal stress UspA family protein